MNSEESGSSRIEVATLGGGCFWCTEAALSMLKGVKKVEPGYSGGASSKPTYEEVCTGETGHAEVVQVRFDPEAISFREILEVFFTVHDPTTLNRQGSDVGTQYRSVIFYHTEAQKTIAEEVIAELNAKRIWGTPIVTHVAPFKSFFKAEDYHLDYYKNNPGEAYCQMVISPKIAKLRNKFLKKLEPS